jgi:multidrug resistance efflux pump
MSWGRLLLLGDWGQQLAIEDVEADVVRLRSRIRNQQSTDRSQDEALITLRREVTDLKLVVAELTRLLVATGAVPAEAVEQLVRGVDRTSAPDEPS